MNIVALVLILGFAYTAYFLEIMHRAAERRHQELMFALSLMRDEINDDDDEYAADEVK